jgi:DNA-binding NarL/FixJ family response regulator
MVKPQTRIVLVDNHPVIRLCIRFIFNRSADTTVIGETDDGQTAVDLVQRLKPDMVIMDIVLSVLDGIEAMRRINKSMPDAKVIALSSHDHNVFVKNMFEAGASGYLFKETLDCERLPAIQKMRENRIYTCRSVVKQCCNVPYFFVFGEGWS